MGARGDIVAGAAPKQGVTTECIVMSTRRRCGKAHQGRLAQIGWERRGGVAEVLRGVRCDVGLSGLRVEAGAASLEMS